MHKLPPDIDLSFLLEQPLDTINFGTHDIWFWFHNGACLVVEHGLHLRFIANFHEDHSWRSGMLIDPESSGLLKLIQQKVSRIDVHNERDIDLKFSNGADLLISGSDVKHECYRITYGDTEVVV